MHAIPFVGLLVTAAGLTLGCGHPPTQPAEATDRPSFGVVSNEVTHEVAGFAINDCTGEALPATATDHELVAVTEDGAGGFHVKILSHVHFTATSEITGARYSGTGSINQTIHDRGQGHVETVQLTFTLIGHGAVPNEVATILFHVTVHPDGTVSSLIDSFRLHCQ
jgi:hypothetical protein